MGIEVSARGLLFDLDGTLIQSRSAIERVLREWAQHMGLDAEQLIAGSHGRRTLDIVRDVCPDDQRQAAHLEQRFLEDLDGVHAIDGAAEFLQRLAPLPWGIVTSAERALALRRLEAAGLPRPAVLVAAEQVQLGKPHPQGYCLGAARLGLAPAQLVVFEDAEAGIAAEVAAGATVIVIGRPAASVPGHLSALDYRGLQLRHSDEQAVVVACSPAMAPEGCR